ncbi:MAG: PTS sugar transporter subunit IIA [Verrucomicrobia bacterium]|nr:PTS sugar transporter subunit IIA [Verrucomicrobiota bacterium]
MMRFRAALESAQIVLDLEAVTLTEAIRKLAETLRSDSRVGAWPELAAAWQAKGNGRLVPVRTGVAFIHARTKAVSDLVMAFGRLHTPVPDHEGLIRFLILIGIPATIDADYARLIGALMRALRDQRLCAAFHDAERPEDVLAILERAETAVGS